MGQACAACAAVQATVGILLLLLLELVTSKLVQVCLHVLLLHLWLQGRHTLVSLRQFLICKVVIIVTSFPCRVVVRGNTLCCKMFRYCYDGGHISILDKDLLSQNSSFPKTGAAMRVVWVFPPSISWRQFMERCSLIMNWCEVTLGKQHGKTLVMSHSPWLFLPNPSSAVDWTAKVCS